jgi:hypothetical protein
MMDLERTGLEGCVQDTVDSKWSSTAGAPEYGIEPFLNINIFRPGTTSSTLSNFCYLTKRKCFPALPLLIKIIVCGVSSMKIISKLPWIQNTRKKKGSFNISPYGWQHKQ